MLEMKGIDKRFGAVVALNKASLTVENGQIAALAGSNGSGKSTMVKVLAGLVAPNAGTGKRRSSTPVRTPPGKILPRHFRI